MSDLSALWRYAEGEAEPEEYRLAMQAIIDSGDCWMMDGSTGRAAMDMLWIGACVLPEVEHRDYWGNRVPSRHQVQPGSTGSMELHKKWMSENRPDDTTT